MARIRGSLDSAHCPITGFVQLPAPAGRKLGLTSRAISQTQYADGRIDGIPLAWGRATLGTTTQEGFIHIQRASNETIVGVQFLGLFRKTLVVSIADGLVLLVDSLADLSAQ